MIRLATYDDITEMETISKESCRKLLKDEIPDEVIEYSLNNGLWVIDTELLDDNTYYVVCEDSRIVGCGGWSKRVKNWNTAHSEFKNIADIYIKRSDPVKLRAFYVHPDYAKKGYGSMIISHCENEARKEGYSRMELNTGVESATHFYKKNGYTIMKELPYAFTPTFTSTTYQMGKNI